MQDHLELVFVIGTLLLRLALVVAGVVFASYGFRLFARVRAAGSAEISIGKMLRLNLVQVAPGVFFALFGASVLLYGIHRQPTLQIQDGLRQVALAGATPPAAPAADRAAQLRAMQQIAWLNRIRVDAASDPVDVADAARWSRDIRLALMRSVWHPDWGERAAFEAWVRDPASTTVNVAAQAVFDRR
ncbi:MAG: hypothetical protein IPJ08_20655 [Burkholderiales bacterium]|nr:hypothetical protein [Burkholderiales bacterium]